MPSVEFHGEPAGSAPLTWGQRNLHRAIGENPPGNFNLSRVITMPRRASMEVPQTGALIRALLARHESLRTVFPDGPEGPRQDVRGAGRVELVVAGCEGDPDRAAEHLRQRLAPPAFHDATELPLRVGLVTTGGLVRRVVLVLSHLAADGIAVDVIERELRLLALRGAVGQPAGLQPRELADRERAAGVRTSDAAVAHWEGLFRRMPPSMFQDAGPAHDPPCQRYTLTSRALLPAVALLAGRHRVSTATVLLAATAVMVARWTGHPTVTISTLVSNRFQDGHQNMVATLAQQGLFGLDLAGPPELPGLIASAGREAMRTYRHAYYDPDQLWSRRDQVSLDRGSWVDPYCCYNDVRAVPDYGTGADPEQLRAAVKEARSETAVEPDGSLPHMHCRFCLRIFDRPGAVSLRLTADTRYLPPDEIQRFLAGTEALLLDDAGR